MPPPSQQSRFLLRGSACLIVLLSLWWFFLLPPMLAVLRGAAGAFVQITPVKTGHWTIRVPVNVTLPAGPERPRAQTINSIDFDIERTDPVAFTFSLPVYWAIVLALPWDRRNLRPALWGSLAIATIELVLFLLFIQISAGNATAQLTGITDAFDKWIRHLGEYLIVSVIPFILPFIIALTFHRELHNEFFPQTLPR